jgi:hypothetical protein
MLHQVRKLIKGKFLVLLVLIFVVGVVGVSAQETIIVDTDSFITAINDWLVIALPIVAIGVGISGAFAIALFIGRMIITAFEGKI